MTSLAPTTAAFFEHRGISPDLVARFEIYTAGYDAKGEVVPSERGGIIAFPFFEHGVVVNEKYRGREKRFWHRKGGKRTFWNCDVLDDPALRDGSQPLVITEGIEDALVAIESGWPLTVSVPDGAPPAKEGDRGDDSPVGQTGKFEFIWNNRDRLGPSRVKRIVLAVDADPPGHRLADELVRLLGAGRCYFVRYPEGCKDLNEVLLKYSADAVREALRDAKPYPLRGIYRLSDYPNLPELQTVSLGWPIFDGLPGNGWLKLFAGEFMVVTGIPSHGKSTWVLNLLVNIAQRERWSSAIFSPEMAAVPHLRNKLRRILGTPDADAFIEKFFTFIDNDPNGIDEDNLSLEWLIEKARDAVLRDGVRILVIDPWNEIEHARKPNEGLSEYIGWAIRQLKRFARQYGVAVIVLAHPTKDVWERGKMRTPTLYDIEGCYSDDTEVLTRRGWLHHGQLTMGDDIACFNPETSAVEYHQPSRIIRREHDGEMFHFVGYGYDALVTPDHRMVVKPKWEEPVGDNNKLGRPVRFEKDKWHLVQANEIPSSNFVIPLAGREMVGADPSRIAIGARTYPIESFLKLAGWYVAEGHAGPTGITWTQAEGKIAEQFTATFAEAAIPATVGWQPPAEPGWAATGRWYIGNRYHPGLLRWFSEHCGMGAANKKIPGSFFDLSPRLKRVFLDAYLQGDGSLTRCGWHAVTISARLRDDLQRLAVELGIATNSAVRQRGADRWATQYEISFGWDHRREVTMRTQRNLTREHYRGLVWCLTVPTGAYLFATTVA